MPLQIHEWIKQHPVNLTILVVWFVGLLAFWCLLGDQETWGGVYVEAWGALFDIVLFGIIISLFESSRQRTASVERYIEEIDDLKNWDSKHSRLRIAGNLRRLAKLGKHDIDFQGIKLSYFSFHGEGIEDISGSVFSEGLNLKKSHRLGASLKKVSFLGVNCSMVTFSGGKVGGLVGKSLSFEYADLTNASFCGALLEWNPEELVPNVSDWYEHIEDESYQIHFPPFWQADLTNCDFSDATIKCADFRDAENVEKAIFRGVRGLETCQFDSEEIKEKIIRSSLKEKGAT